MAMAWTMMKKQCRSSIAKFLGFTTAIETEAIQYAYNPDEDCVEVEAKLRERLESFLDTARSFNLIYSKKFVQWTHMMEVSQLHGFGPGANRLLDTYKTLLKFLWNLRNLKDLNAAVALGSAETAADEPSSVTRIITECE